MTRVRHTPLLFCLFVSSSELNWLNIRFFCISELVWNNILNVCQVCKKLFFFWQSWHISKTHLSIKNVDVHRDLTLIYSVYSSFIFSFHSSHFFHSSFMKFMHPLPPWKTHIFKGKQFHTDIFFSKASPPTDI